MKEFRALMAGGGVDVLFVGPYDLSQSLGVVDQVDHSLVVETITRIVGRCVEKGVCAGLFTAACTAAVKELREG